MDHPYVLGVGQIAQAIADLALRKDFLAAYNAFMLGLGHFGVHQQIAAVLSTHPGVVTGSEHFEGDHHHHEGDGHDHAEHDKALGKTETQPPTDPTANAPGTVPPPPVG